LNAKVWKKYDTAKKCTRLVFQQTSGSSFQQLPTRKVIEPT